MNKINSLQIFTFVFLLSGLSNSSRAEQEAPKLKITEPHPHAFTYSSLQKGTMYVISCEDESHTEYGSFVIWKADKNGQLTNLTSLTALDKVLREQTDQIGDDPAYRSKVMAMIAPALSEYIRVTADGSPLFNDEIKEYFNLVKPYIPDSMYKTLSKRFTLPANKSDKFDNTWIIPFLILRSDGSLELDQFSGSFRPVGITKRETEILIGSGVVPIEKIRKNKSEPK